MQAFKPLYLLYVWQLCSRARGPCRTRQGCEARNVTPRRSNCYPSRCCQLVFFDFTAILIVHVRACGIFTFTQSMVTSKNVSQGTHHVRKSSRPSLAPSAWRLLLRFPPTHLIVGERNCSGGLSLETRPPPVASKPGLLPPPYAIARADN